MNPEKLYVLPDARIKSTFIKQIILQTKGNLACEY